MDAKKDIFQQVPGSENFPSPDEEKKGDVHSEEILTGISQRKSLFDLEITGFGERNRDQGAAGTCVSLHSDLGA